MTKKTPTTTASSTEDSSPSLEQLAVQAARPPYQIDYETFLGKYANEQIQISAEDVGATIARMAQYFSDSNTRRAKLEILANARAAEIYQTEDGGKPISAAKAKIIMEATGEAKDHLLAKADIENIEQYINALKYLQKGILNEYSHMGA